MTSFEETVFRLEPCLPERPSERLLELAGEAWSRACSLTSGIHPYTAFAIARYVRLVEAASSCRLEGIDARPLDIAEILAGRVVPSDRRVAALAGRAAEIVQSELDGVHRAGPEGSARQIAWIHRRLYEEMPSEFAAIPGPDGGTVEIPAGRFRGGGEPVRIGRHLPPTDPAAFLDRFEERYVPKIRQGVEGIVAFAASHHRLLYIHPFVDGNGRTARLASHAIADRVGLRGGNMWSLSRAFLTAGIDRYRGMLDHADMPRQGGLDGRGNLSDRALVAFCEWMLEAVLAEFASVASAFSAAAIEERFRSVAVGLAPHASDLVAAILLYGHANPRDFAFVRGLDVSEGMAAAGALVDAGLAVWVAGIPGTGPLRIAIPLAHHRTLLPGLLDKGSA